MPHQNQTPETVYDVAWMGAADIEPDQAPSSPAHSGTRSQKQPPKQHDISEKMPPEESSSQPSATPAAKPSASVAETDNVKEHAGEKRKQVAEDTGARMGTGDAAVSAGDTTANANTGDASAGAGDASASAEDAGNGIPPVSDAIEAPAVPPRVLSSRAPEYPSSAQNRGTEGTVVIRFLLDKEGSVDDMEIVESSGSNALDRAARNAAAGFSFSPGLDGYGRPVRCYVYQTFTFRLK